MNEPLSQTPANPAGSPPLPQSDMPLLAIPHLGPAFGVPHHEATAHAPDPGKATLTCIDYGPEHFQIEEVKDPAEFVARHRPEWSVVRWINVDWATDPGLIQALAGKYQLHPLAVEDVLHPGQRPKTEDYPADAESPGRLFVLARMLQIVDHRCRSEQIAFFLGRSTLITFQQDPGDVFGPIRQRIKTKGSRLRNGDASFLLYALIDAIVDHLFPILDHFSERLTALEESVLKRPARNTVTSIYRIKRELVVLRRAVWPMRDLVLQLQREPHVCLSDVTQTYLRDVYDHLVHLIDLVETYREIATGLTETYMSAVSNRMNEVMKTLTIISTIFVPLTFLAGVYGMNMPIPENHHEITYPLFWVFALLLAGGMLYWFRRRGWF
jgi:magnesium transporter